MKIRDLINLLEDLKLEEAEVCAGPDVDAIIPVTGVWVTEVGSRGVLRVVLATPKA